MLQVTEPLLVHSRQVLQLHERGNVELRGHWKRRRVTKTGDKWSPDVSTATAGRLRGDKASRSRCVAATACKSRQWVLFKHRSCCTHNPWISFTGIILEVKKRCIIIMGGIFCSAQNTFYVNCWSTFGIFRLLCFKHKVINMFLHWLTISLDSQDSSYTDCKPWDVDSINSIQNRQVD